MKRKVWALLLVALVSVAVACAGGSETKTSPPLPPDAMPVKPVDSAPSPEPAREATRPAAPPTGDVGSLPLDAVGVDRKVVYNARLDLEVEDVDAAVDHVQRMATSLGGGLMNASVRDEGQGGERRRVADVTVRVPASAHADALSQLRRLASRVRTETAQSSDVTEEYADLQARLRNLQATEARYLELLGQARNIGEVLQVQDRLNSVRLEIERIQGRINLLDRLAEMATITVHLEPPAAAAETPWHPGDVAANAWEALRAIMQGLATAAIYFAIAGGWLAVLLALGLLVWRRWQAARSST